MTTPTLDLDTLDLKKGGHTDRDRGVCLMEAVAWFAGKEHTDSPPCVSPILGAFGRNLNDVLPDDKRQQLKPFIPRLPGTAGDGRDQARGLMAADWLIRVYTPTWLRLAGLEAEAVSLETLPRQASWDDVEAAVPVVRQAKEKAAAAWAAAWAAAGDAARAAAGDAARAAAWAAARDAARAAAGDAAGDAARDAAGDAARAAAWAAARDAARAAARAAAGDAARAAARAAARDAARAAARAAAGDAARAAARDAAKDKLQPTVDALQDSAIELFDRLITTDSEGPIA